MATLIFTITVVLTAPVFIMIAYTSFTDSILQGFTYQFAGIFVAHAAHIAIIIYFLYDPEMSESIRSVFKTIKNVKSRPSSGTLVNY